REISEKHGMELTNHSLYLYGKCSNLTNCDEKK
ncbi:TPA: transcriptional repressor, partial [Mannheimia haemolytica]|nr:transcriptional repressor [Mannheimia haemolytica]